MKEILNQLGIESMLLIGGIAGTLVALKKSNEKWYQSLFTILVGILGAVYLSPLICSMFSISEDKVRGGIAFLIGYGGINLIDKILGKATKSIEDGNIK